MAAPRSAAGIFQELSDLFVSNPSPEDLLNYRPSRGLQRRARTLLAKQDQGRLTDKEKQKLDEFLQADALMELVKAKLHARIASER
jgi:hypothetical protein